MKNLLVGVITEGHMGEHDVMPLELHRCIPVILFLAFQNLIH